MSAISLVLAASALSASVPLTIAAPSPVANTAPPQAGATAEPDPSASQDAIVVEAQRPAVQGDPFERVNESAFVATQAVDRAVVGPIALGYKNAVPEPIRDGLHNVLSNLHEPVVLLNFLIQGKAGKACETLGRLAINSTAGAAGLFDIAKRQAFKLPHRANGFADSLGFYGVKPGPYFFLPLVGPTTLRDLVGGGIDRLVLPLAIGKPFTQPAYSTSSSIVGALNRRVEIDDDLTRLRGQSSNPYAAMRTSYLTKRQAEIDGLRGLRRGSN